MKKILVTTLLAILILLCGFSISSSLSTLVYDSYSSYANIVALVNTNKTSQLGQVASSLSNGLVAHYTFDEGSGTTAGDSSGNSNMGTLVNGVSWTTGKNGTALQFDGTNDQINTTSDFISTNPLTFCVWLYSRSTAANLTVLTNGKTTLGYSVGRFFFTSGSSNTLSATNSTLANVWQHWCVTRNSSAITNFYLNGTLNGTADQSGGSITAGTINVKLGAALNGTNTFNGLMDDVRFYGRVLSASEISEIYNYSSADAGSHSLNTLTIQKDGTGNGVILNSGGLVVINCGSTCESKNISSGTSITLIPQPDSDSSFVQWSGGGCSGATNCTIVLNSNLILKATFNINTEESSSLPAPSSFVAVPVSATQVKLSWDSSGDVAGYYIYRCAGLSCTPSLIETSPTNSYVDTSGLSPNTNYSYAVASYDRSIPKKISQLSHIAKALTASVPPTANGITEAGEACDGPDLGGKTYATITAGYVGGTLRCKGDRSGYDISELIPGPTIEAVSCSSADVQDAINNAKDGTTVLVPEGRCEWQVPVSVGKIFNIQTQNYNIDMKSIVLKGAGIGKTIIVDMRKNYEKDDKGRIVYPRSALSIIAAVNKPIRVTGFTFDGTGSQRSQGPINVNTSSSPSASVRIDHNEFKNLSGSAGVILASVYGLVDNNTFIQAVPPVTAVTVTGDSATAWDRPLSFGTENAVYVEDNTFIFPFGYANGPLDAYQGARYVLRHNVFDGTIPGHHGYDSGTVGTFSCEVYSNIWKNTAKSPLSVLFEGRAGTCVFYDNIANDPAILTKYFFAIRNYRSSDGYSMAYGRTLGYDASDNTGMCNGIHLPKPDGNTPGMQGYPCKDQWGRTMGQALAPTYAWNNTLNGKIGGDIVVAGYNSETLSPPWNDRNFIHIVEGRDFFKNPRPGYVPYPYPHPLTQFDSDDFGIPVQPQPPTPTITPSVTPPVADTTPPSLTTISASVTTRGATINFSTNEGGTTQVQYGLTTSYGNTTPLVSTLTTSHSVTLTTLTPNTLYHYRIITKDSSGNTTTSSDGIFSTLPLPEVTLPNTSPTPTPINIPPAISTPLPPTTGAVSNLPSSRLPPTFRFTTQLNPYTTSLNVKNLQIFLNDHGFTLTTIGAGSEGNETTYYGPLTKQAVTRFQNYYKPEILTANRLTRATGQFGPASMKKANQLLTVDARGTQQTTLPQESIIQQLIRIIRGY